MAASRTAAAVTVVAAASSSWRKGVPHTISAA
jgi:hypothetical protein